MKRCNIEVLLKSAYGVLIVVETLIAVGTWLVMRIGWCSSLLSSPGILEIRCASKHNGRNLCKSS